MYDQWAVEKENRGKGGGGSFCNKNFLSNSTLEATLTLSSGLNNAMSAAVRDAFSDTITSAVALTVHGNSTVPYSHEH